MEQERRNYMFAEQGRPDSVVHTTMERAIEIARDRVLNRRTEVVLSAECPVDSGRFIRLGTYVYLPERDGERLILSIPKIPKNIIDL